MFSKFSKVITVEDGCLMGGFGSAVIEFMVDNKYNAEVVRLGIPDKYVHHGTVEELQEELGYDAKGLAATVIQMLNISIESDDLLNEKAG